ncbi:hypothetical protein QZM35_22735 [Burkholderia sp. AU45274]|uniref:hypothetical protein n=1 Tax=Burkholderia sp. AU45274 TaxID=3059205 RepID=UPI00264F081A|nr:hypothetical protein [Burkholderia sp. AU45274]MDN7489464.1 hypothetical protein [Burkholderia sp. AU45274]MDN7490531.1 hypothetical protein [Burkholderia sp. AU45274]
MNIATMNQRELLAQINQASNARRRYELADGNRWRDERHAREAVGAELDALVAEWHRRNLE